LTKISIVSGLQSTYSRTAVYLNGTRLSEILVRKIFDTRICTRL